jgi:hypothetical protein
MTLSLRRCQEPPWISSLYARGSVRRVGSLPVSLSNAATQASHSLPSNSATNTQAFHRSLTSSPLPSPLLERKTSCQCLLVCCSKRRYCPGSHSARAPLISRPAPQSRPVAATSPAFAVTQRLHSRFGCRTCPAATVLNHLHPVFRLSSLSVHRSLAMVESDTYLLCRRDLSPPLEAITCDIISCRLRSLRCRSFGLLSHSVGLSLRRRRQHLLFPCTSSASCRKNTSATATRLRVLHSRAVTSCPQISFRFLFRAAIRTPSPSPSACVRLRAFALVSAAYSLLPLHSWTVPSSLIYHSSPTPFRHRLHASALAPVNATDDVAAPLARASRGLALAPSRGCPSPLVPLTPPPTPTKLMHSDSEKTPDPWICMRPTGTSWPLNGPTAPSRSSTIE